MYSGTPKSKIHLANEAPVTPIKTRSTMGMYLIIMRFVFDVYAEESYSTKKRVILDDPVESLLISQRYVYSPYRFYSLDNLLFYIYRSKKSKTTNIAAQPSIEESDDDNKYVLLLTHLRMCIFMYQVCLYFFYLKKLDGNMPQAAIYTKFCTFSPCCPHKIL